MRAVLQYQEDTNMLGIEHCNPKSSKLAHELALTGKHTTYQKWGCIRASS